MRRSGTIMEDHWAVVLFVLLTSTAISSSSTEMCSQSHANERIVCEFNRTWCGWRNIGWTFYPESDGDYTHGAVANMTNKGMGSYASLSSPLSCTNTHYSLTIQYRVNCRGCILAVLQNHNGRFYTLWETQEYSDDTRTQKLTIFSSGGNVSIIIDVIKLRITGSTSEVLVVSVSLEMGGLIMPTTNQRSTLSPTTQMTSLERQRTTEGVFDDAGEDDKNSESRLAVGVGVSLAVVAVVVGVVVTIVVVRRKRKDNNEKQKRETSSGSLESGDVSLAYSTAYALEYGSSGTSDRPQETSNASYASPQSPSVIMTSYDYVEMGVPLAKRDGDERQYSSSLEDPSANRAVPRQPKSTSKSSGYLKMIFPFARRGGNNARQCKSPQKNSGATTDVSRKHSVTKTSSDYLEMGVPFTKRDGGEGSLYSSPNERVVTEKTRETDYDHPVTVNRQPEHFYSTPQYRQESKADGERLVRTEANSGQKSGPMKDAKHYINVVPKTTAAEACKKRGKNVYERLAPPERRQEGEYSKLQVSDNIK